MDNREGKSKVKLDQGIVAAAERIQGLRDKGELQGVTAVELHCRDDTIRVVQIGNDRSMSLDEVNDEPGAIGLFLKNCKYKARRIKSLKLRFNSDCKVTHVEIERPPGRFTLSEKMIPSSRTTGYVYVLRADEGFYKIGATRSLPRRLANINSSVPSVLTLVAICRAADIYELESMIHHAFAGQRVKGEWFNLDPECITKLQLSAFGEFEMIDREVSQYCEAAL